MSARDNLRGADHPAVPGAGGQGGASPMTRARYLIIGLLFFHTVNTYMDRVCMAAAAEGLKRDLQVSDQMMGYIFGIFAVGYALFQVPAGWFIDRVGPRKSLAWIVGIWSAFTVLSGAAWSGAAMLVLRFLFGVGEAGAFPGATRAMYAWIPVQERGLANGIFHSGARVGAAVSLFLMPLLVIAVGWRMTFVLNGIVGLVWVAAWLWWFRDEPRDHPKVGRAELEHIERGRELPGAAAAAADNTPIVPLLTVLGSRNMLLAMFQYFASNLTFFISFTWLLPYMTTRWGDVAMYYAPIPLLAGTFAQWTSGALINRLHALGWGAASRRAPAIFGFWLSAVGLVICTQVSLATPLAFTLLFSVAVFGVEMTISPSWTFCQDIGGTRSGTISAAMNMMGNLGSALSAIVFPLFVSQVTLPFFAPQTGTSNSFFAVAAGCNILAGAAWFFMNPARSTQEGGGRRWLGVSVLVAGVMVLGALLLYPLLVPKR